MDERDVKYYFTGFQLLTTGEQVPFNTFVFDTVTEYKSKYATEMQYAIAATDTIDGYVIIVYDSFGSLVVQDSWNREHTNEE